MMVSKNLKITKRVLKTHRYTDEREGGGGERERERRDREREGMRARGDRGA